jgi:hypothetical protein
MFKELTSRDDGSWLEQRVEIGNKWSKRKDLTHWLTKCNKQNGLNSYLHMSMLRSRDSKHCTERYPYTANDRNQTSLTCHSHLTFTFTLTPLNLLSVNLNPCIQRASKKITGSIEARRQVTGHIPTALYSLSLDACFATSCSTSASLWVTVPVVACFLVQGVS